MSSCPSCNGLWVGGPQLNNLKKSFSIDLNKTPGEKKDTAFKCSSCRGKIKELSLHKDPDEVFLDRCESCQGIWFDQGELKKTQDLFTRVGAVFTPKTIDSQKRKTVAREKLSKAYGVSAPAAKQPTRERNAFIARVYRLFLSSLLSAGFAALIGVVIDLPQSTALYLFFAEIAALLWVFWVRKNKKWNLTALFTFTSLSGLALSPMLRGMIDDGEGLFIPVAFGITAVIFGGLTWYAHYAKKDFSYLGGFLYSGLIVLVGAGFAKIFYPDLFSNLLYSSIGVILFSGFVLFDTSRIIYKYNTEEYVAAAIDLYLDFLNIFLDILLILRDTSSVSDFFPTDSN